MDLDQSNASEAFRRSRSISLRGFGPGNAGLFWFLFSFLYFLLCSPLFLLIGSLCTLIFSQKFQKNSYVFLMRFWLFRDIFTCLKLIKIVRVNFSTDSYILYIFVCNFSHASWSKYLSLDIGVWHLSSWYDHFWFYAIFSILLSLFFCLRFCNISNFVSLVLVHNFAIFSILLVWFLFTILQYVQSC